MIRSSREMLTETYHEQCMSIINKTMTRYRHKGINSYRFKFVIQEKKAFGSNRSAFTMKLAIDSPIFHYHIHVLKKNLLNSLVIKFNQISSNDNEYDIKLVSRPDVHKLLKHTKKNSAGKRVKPTEKEIRFLNAFNNALRRFETNNNNRRIRRKSVFYEYKMEKNMVIKMSSYVNDQMTEFFQKSFGEPVNVSKNYFKNNHISKTLMCTDQKIWQTDLTLEQIQQLSCKILNIKLDFSANSINSGKDMFGII